MYLAPIAFAIVVILIAAIVRGFSGFGFSLIAITGLSLVFPPVEVIGAVFIMELAASLHLLPGIWRAINWRAVGLLTLGAAVGTPLGVHALASLPAAPMRLALAVFVLVTVVLLLSGFALKRAPGNAATAATGVASGVLNGAFGIGGPPVILFFFSTPTGAAAGRASMTAFWLATDVMGLGNQFLRHLLTVDHLFKAALFLPPLLVGIVIGRRLFGRIDEERFRRIVLVLLGIMAVAIGVMAARELAGTAS